MLVARIYFFLQNQIKMWSFYLYLEADYHILGSKSKTSAATPLFYYIFFISLQIALTYVEISIFSIEEVNFFNYFGRSFF